MGGKLAPKAPSIGLQADGLAWWRKEAAWNAAKKCRSTQHRLQTQEVRKDGA